MGRGRGAVVLAETPSARAASTRLAVLAILKWLIFIFFFLLFGCAGRYETIGYNGFFHGYLSRGRTQPVAEGHSETGIREVGRRRWGDTHAIGMDRAAAMLRGRCARTNA